MSLSILLSSFPPGVEEHAVIQQTGLPILETIASKSPQIFLEADDTLVHKFNVKISGLLKSKSPVCRWFGAYLAKMSVDASPLILKSHGATWANILIHILELPEPPVTTQIAVQALSSIFANTVGKSELTREITTPRLPAYLKLLLNKLKDIVKGFTSGSSNASANQTTVLIPTLVKALTRVLRQQSTSFRPFSGGFHTCLVDLLNQSISSPASIPDELLQDICTAYVCLHMSATKGTEAEEWRSACIAVINEIHITADQLAIKYVREDNANSSSNNNYNRHPVLNLQPAGFNTSASASPESVSPLAYVKHFEVLFCLLTSFFTTPTKISVKMPLGAIEDLTDRLYSISRYTTKQPVLDKTLYSIFLSVMDKVHVLVTALNITLLPVVGNSVLEHFDMLLHHISALCDGADQTVQLVLLQFVSKLLVQVSVVPKSYTQTVSRLIHPISTSLVTDRTTSDPRFQQLSDFISNSKAFQNPVPSYVNNVVSEFFTAVLKTMPDLPLNIRAEIDRYFIFSSNQSGLNTSALYPGNLARYSVAPMAARLDSGLGLASSLIHPRLPPLAVSTQNLTKTASIDPSATNGIASQPENTHEDDLYHSHTSITTTTTEYQAQLSSHPSQTMEIDELPAPVEPTPASIARKELPPPLVTNRPSEPIVAPPTPASQPAPNQPVQQLVDDVVPLPAPTVAPTYAPDSDSDDDVEIPIIIDADSDSDEDM
ncbi:ribosome biogenesis protein Rix1 (predicted) [Sugiyamaella lignohabitans]|uniref:Pre-rRNA-processing protein RIX1 n=1 Tax=Sugiyamaella lignohabitans TaxID=796027 RepID=A0A167D514_9ASCO|nr:ribosome biogenesis protein Rix1 (predicted) [Sugiyamaella lignohabitans]ANB12491.1 ribosome biogenesis protein Rix1 (predicted) [Sugiyamaella lignohabitans]